jgi:N-methylhydantoinase A/oxoprolinase/acetone carboxylase beta subunit/N-methylhydantoinase B/oxoprolinase/acetone carboxylase alpha subunit
MAAALSLGIDIGGTFTDLVAFDPESGQAWIGKVSTTPDDPADGAIAGVYQLLQQHQLAPERFGRVVHATTLFTNALIERKGARTGLITTAGFRDTLEIGRERKYELYDLFIEMPRPLVPRPWRREVAERLAPDGTVEHALDVASLLREAESLVADGVESLAVVFLHAYANPVHECQAAEALAGWFPGLSVSLSSDIAAEIREFPRASTTVANAYVRPLAERYLDTLETRLRGLGIGGGFFLMLSSGGLTHVAEAKRAPVQLLESGPAAGALAGAWFGRNAGLERVLAFDMGGTTAKLALVDDGIPLVAWGFEAARAKRFLRGSGLPIQIATIELIEIGAGGGSIARRSELGTLHVGPDSAGAAPGPACYGRGGDAATVTDADLLLGYLNADFFLGGAMRIDPGAAERAVGTLADQLGIPAMRAAYGVHDVVNENMAGAARVAIAERGRIPHEYALMATGGAAPVHAWQVARKLGVKRLVCPPGAGVGSTIGMLMAQARVDRVASLNVGLGQADWNAVAAVFARLRQEAEAVVAATGAVLAQASALRLADMRYVGQGSEITIAVPEDLNAETARAAFETVYRALYGRTPPGAAIQFVALRLALSAPMPGSGGRLRQERSTGAARKGTRAVWFPEADGLVETAVYDRYALRTGDAVDGPAVFEETESTFVIGPGGRATVLDDGTIDVVMPAVATTSRVMVGPRARPEADPRTGYGRPPTTLLGDRRQVVSGRADPRVKPGDGRDTKSGASDFDPVTLELLWRRLISLVDEAAAALVRTSFSTLVRESYDFSCIVTDDRGQSLVQATESIPSFIGTLPATVKHFLRFFPPETLSPGDVLITNDLWLGTGHLPDITVAKPIFRHGKLVAFSASTAHAPDIGGKIRSPEPREVFEEGLQIPPWKLMRAGVTDETLVALIRQNVRTPDQTMGDLWAQVVALDLMEERVGALMRGYGLDDLRALAGEIHGRCEQAMRAAIAALPDGTYHSELQTDGVLDQPVTIRMALTIKGDSIEIDYAGTDPQVDRAINCALCYTYAMSVYGVKVCTSPTLPNNEGAFRPISIRAPDGCIVNPVFPASGGSRMLIGHYLPMLVFGCLGQIVPERVMAACGSPMWGMNQSGLREPSPGETSKPYANMFFFNGGMGATMQGDGQSCLSWPSNVSSTSVEISEHIAPLRFHHKKLREGSGGAGRHRGGLGQEILIESRSANPVAVSFLAERTVFPAFGIEGGEAGAPGVLRINGAAVDPKRQYILRQGDTVLLATPGGGGHGDPASRDATALHEDQVAGTIDPSET